MVITAALTNALKVVGKKKEQVKVVLNGIGAAGGAAAKLLLEDRYLLRVPLQRGQCRRAGS